MPNRPNLRAFTLIEMLCVILILAIAAVIVIPQINSRGDLKAAAASRAIMADFVYAQTRAIDRQTTEYITFNAAAQTYALQEGTPPATLTNPVTQSPYVQVFGGSGFTEVTLTSAAFDGKTTIAFDEIGAPYSYDSITGQAALASGQIKIASDGFTMTLNVQPYTGEITVQTP